MTWFLVQLGENKYLQIFKEKKIARARLKNLLLFINPKLHVKSYCYLYEMDR